MLNPTTADVRSKGSRSVDLYGGSSPDAKDERKLDRLNQFKKDRQIALARLDSKLELKRQWYMLGRATGDLAVVDISTELSWSCMTCICTPQTQGYKKLLDHASPLPVAAPWRPSHDTTVTTSAGRARRKEIWSR